jgi:phosphate-selective porin OprO and OprP
MARKISSALPALVGSVAASLAILGDTPAPPVDAETVQRLLHRIEELEKKVSQLEHPQTATAPSTPTAPDTGRVEALEQQVKVLQRQNELAGEAAKEAAKTNPVVSFSHDGFKFRDANTNYSIGLHAVLQLDSRWYLDHAGPAAGTDTFLIRRARPIIDGIVDHDFNFLVVPDFGGASGPTLFDAYLNYTYAPWLQVQGGKYKSPLGFEELMADQYLWFAERGFPTQLLPNRDVGITLHGDVAEGLLSYAAGVLNNVGDNRNSSNVDFDNRKAFEGRLFLKPFIRSETSLVRNLGFGVAGNVGDLIGANGLPNNNGFTTDGQQAIFTYLTGAGTAAAPNVTANGRTWHLAPQAYWQWENFGLLGEYTISSQQLAKTAGPATSYLTPQNSGWQLLGTWALTGESESSSGLRPRHPFNPAENHWGAFELAVRYEQIHFDKTIFAAGFADPAKSASDASSYGIGLNWILTRNIKAAVDFHYTDFTGGKASPVKSV